MAPLFDKDGNEIAVSALKKSKKTMYESQETTDQLKLHRMSALYKDKPAHVVYQEVYASEDPSTGSYTYYMKGAT